MLVVLKGKVQSIPQWLLPPLKPQPLFSKKQKQCRVVKGVASV